MLKKKTLYGHTGGMVEQWGVGMFEQMRVGMVEQWGVGMVEQWRKTNVAYKFV